jgi:hypothetical protein
MSSQPPDGQGPEQQPPSGTPPEMGPPGLPPSPPPGGDAPGGLGGRPSKSRAVLILGIVGAVVVLTGLAAVFTGDEDADEAGDYCGLLEDNGNAFAYMISGNVDPSNFDEAVGALHELREAAPDDVADEWAALDGPFQELQEVIDVAGLSWEELLQTAPQDVDPEVRDAGERFADDLGSIDVDAIDQTLNDHADEECGLDLEDMPG